MEKNIFINYPLLTKYADNFDFQPMNRFYIPQPTRPSSNNLTEIATPECQDCASSQICESLKDLSQNKG